MPGSKQNELHLNTYLGLFTKSHYDKTNVIAASELVFLSIKDTDYELLLPRYLVEIHSREMKNLIKEKRKEINDRKTRGENNEDQISTNKQKNDNEKMSIELGKPSDYIY